MEFDVWYEEYNVALEFQGPQHFGPTPMFDIKTVEMQQALDLMKAGNCLKKNITLIEVTYETLSCASIINAVRPYLLLRHVHGNEKIMAILEYLKHIF